MADRHPYAPHATAALDPGRKATDSGPRRLAFSPLASPGALVRRLVPDLGPGSAAGRTTDAARPSQPYRAASYDRSALVLVPLRVFVGVIWLRAAAEKLIDPAWWDGSAVEAFVTTQLATHSVAAQWCAWLARTVLLPNAQAVAWVVVVLETLAGLAILLGVATASFLAVGIGLNVCFLLMGAVNPSAFYIPMQATLLIGDAGAVAGFADALAADRPRRLRRWHDRVLADTRVWWLAAGVLAAIGVLATLQIARFTPALLVGDPFAVLALLSVIGALGALIQADAHGAVLRWRAGPDRTAGAPVASPAPSVPVASPAPPAPVAEGGRPALPQVPANQEDAVRDYLRGIHDPDALRDHAALADVQAEIDRTDDGLARLRLRQRLIDLQQPPLSSYEASFIEHAGPWADGNGVRGEAFAAEGVPVDVLRRAGFRIDTGGGRAPRRRRPDNARTVQGRRRPVTADEVRAAIPSGTFTATRLQELSGASAGNVRRVIRDGIGSRALIARGVDADHRGPGRPPAIYERS